MKELEVGDLVYFNNGMHLLKVRCKWFGGNCCASPSSDEVDDIQYGFDYQYSWLKLPLPGKTILITTCPGYYCSHKYLETVDVELLDIGSELI